MFPKCKKCYGEMKPLLHTEFYCPKCEADPKPVAKQGDLAFPDWASSAPIKYLPTGYDDDKTIEIDPRWYIITWNDLIQEFDRLSTKKERKE